MALGEMSMFSWKSRATQEKEQEEYAIWAFPYGQSQRDNLEALLQAIYPGGSIAISLIQFLTCKELYEGEIKKTGPGDKALNALINIQKDYKHIIKKKDMTTYIALVLADADIDERCQYPTADEIRARARELESARNRK